jgi:hypothetical protein
MKTINSEHFRLNSHVLIATELTGPITPGKIEALLDAGAVEVRMGPNRWWRVRRNGRTKRWTSRPEEFRIPIKMGLRNYGYITHLDFV